MSGSAWYFVPVPDFVSGAIGLSETIGCAATAKQETKVKYIKAHACFFMKIALIEIPAGSHPK